MRGNGVTQTVELFNYDAGDWEVADARLAKRFDQTVEISLGGDLSRFVEASTRCIEARISYDSTFRHIFLKYGSVYLDDFPVTGRLNDWTIST